MTLIDMCVIVRGARRRRASTCGPALVPAHTARGAAAGVVLDAAAGVDGRARVPNAAAAAQRERGAARGRRRRRRQVRVRRGARVCGAGGVLAVVVIVVVVAVAGWRLLFW